MIFLQYVFIIVIAVFSSLLIVSQDIKEGELPYYFLQLPEQKIVDRLNIDSEELSFAMDKSNSSQTFLLLDVPFTPQAPEADWSYPWQDACEEAAVLMVYAYYDKVNLTSKIAKQELLKLIEWQNENFGDYHDTDIEDTARMAQEVYKLDTKVIDNPSLDTIKQELQYGNMVILPMAGRLLGNLFFTPPGPAYHMLVLIGYDDETNEFIVNDPGTRRGKEYRYSYDIILESIHDWTGSKATIVEGAKKALILQGIHNEN